MTCATVNKELKSQKIPVKMYRGKGYYYFMADAPYTFSVPSIYSFDLRAWTLAQIIDYVKPFYLIK